jgi:hypothetical protein
MQHDRRDVDDGDSRYYRRNSTVSTRRLTFYIHYKFCLSSLCSLFFLHCHISAGQFALLGTSHVLVRSRSSLADRSLITVITYRTCALSAHYMIDCLRLHLTELLLSTLLVRLLLQEVVNLCNVCVVCCVLCVVCLCVCVFACFVMRVVWCALYGVCVCECVCLCGVCVCCVCVCVVCVVCVVLCCVVLCCVVLCCVFVCVRACVCVACVCLLVCRCVWVSVSVRVYVV